MPGQPLPSGRGRGCNKNYRTMRGSVYANAPKIEQTRASKAFRDDLLELIGPHLLVFDRPPFTYAQLVVIALVMMQKAAAWTDIMAWICMNFRYYGYVVCATHFGQHDGISLGISTSWRDARNEFDDSMGRDEPGDVFRQYEPPIYATSDRQVPLWRTKVSEARIFLGLANVHLSPGGFRFLALPAEVRTRIYECILALPAIEPLFHGGKWRLQARTKDPDSTITPSVMSFVQRTVSQVINCHSPTAIMYVNKEIYKEASPVFYGTNAWYFDDYGLSQKFLLTVPVNCEYLTKIILNHTPGGLPKRRRAHTMARTLKQVGKFFTHLFELKRLKSVHIYISERDWSLCWNEYLYGTPYAFEHIPGVAEMKKVRGLQAVGFYGDCENIKHLLEPVMTLAIDDDTHGN